MLLEIAPAVTFEDTPRRVSRIVNTHSSFAVLLR